MQHVHGSQEADSFYVQDCREVQNNTHSIQTLTGQISKLVSVPVAEDLPRCRQMVEEAVASAAETRAILARIREHQKQAQNPAERNNRRMMYQKLSDNLGITARVLEDVVRKFLNHERKRADSLKDQAAEGSMMDAADAAGGEEQLISMGDGPLKQDAGKTVRRAEEHMEALRRIYTDLSNVADEQEGCFENFESRLLSESGIGNMDIERGREEITLPGKYQLDGLRQRKYAIGGGVLALVAMVSFFSAS